VTPERTATTWSYRGPSIDEGVLRSDYNLLESTTCFCMARKKMGEALCAACFKAIRAEDRAKLAPLRPGDGIAEQVSGVHRELLLRFGGWRR
jgi:hypothetical protein